MAWLIQTSLTQSTSHHHHVRPHHHFAIIGNYGVRLGGAGGAERMMLEEASTLAPMGFILNPTPRMIPLSPPPPPLHETLQCLLILLGTKPAILTTAYKALRVPSSVPLPSHLLPRSSSHTPLQTSCWTLAFLQLLKHTQGTPA